VVQTEHLASEVMAAVSAGVREGTATTKTKCLNNDWKSTLKCTEFAHGRIHE
jgi:hypothetical protein